MLSLHLELFSFTCEGAREVSAFMLFSKASFSFCKLLYAWTISEKLNSIYKTTLVFLVLL